MSIVARQSRRRRSRARAGRTTRVLNRPLLLGTLLALAVLTPMGYFWHRFQIGRAAGAYLDRAAALEAQGKWESAAEYLHRYLRVRPERADVRVRLARVYDKSAARPDRKRRAAELYFRAVGLAPRDAALRRRLAELLLETQQFAGAEEQARRLLELAPDDPTALRVAALAAYGRTLLNERGAATLDEAARKLERALEIEPGNVQLATTLARLYREKLDAPDRAARAQMADAVIERMVKANPRSAAARLARHAYRRQYAPEESSPVDVEQAVALEPRNPAALLTAGEAALRAAASASDSPRREAELQRAEHYFRQAIATDAENPGGHLGLGQALHAQGRRAAALAAWQAGLRTVGGENLELGARVAQEFIALERFDRASRSLARLEAAFDRLAPRLSRPNRQLAQSAIDFIEAKLRLAEDQPRRAAALLRSVVTTRKAANVQSERGRDELFDSQFLLGGAYAALRQWDRAAEAFAEALQARPKSRRARLLLAQALAKAGRVADAAARYEELAEAVALSGSAWLLAMEIALKQQLALPKGRRNWDAVQSRLDQPPEDVRDDWRLALLRADLLLARDGRAALDQVLPLLAPAKRLQPQNAELLSRLALIHQRLGKPAIARRLLRTLEEQLGRKSRWYLLKANLLAGEGGAAEAVALLQKALKSLPDQKHPALLAGLVRLHLRQGDSSAARQSLEKLHALQPDRLDAARDLAELALEQQAFEQVERWEAELKRIEGEPGCHWRYYRAWRLAIQSTGADDPRFIEAEQLQTAILDRRPNWPPGHLLRAQLARQHGDWDKAVASYRRALELGETRLAVHERLIETLYRARRFTEAEKHLARLREYAAYSERLSSVEIALAHRRGETRRAVELARRAVERDPNNPLARVRLGRALLLDGQAGEAGEVLRAAREAAPENVQVWSALLSFYLRAGRREQALQTLRGLPESDELSAAARQFVLGQGYELLGDRARADEHYRAALRLDPKNAKIHLRVAQFQLNHDSIAAERTLRRVLELDPRQGLARRELATLLAARGGEASWREALQLLASAPPAADARGHNRRLQAALLVRRGGAKNRARARQILEQLVLDPSESVAGDRVLLARLYEVEDDFAAAREQYLALAGRREPKAAHLALFIDSLLRHDQPREAAPWLARLRALAPRALDTLRLEVRWLQALGRGGEIEPRVEAYAAERWKTLDDERASARFCLEIGNLYHRVGMYEPARRWYEKLAAQKPRAYGPLAECLAAMGRLPEAIALCRAKWKTDPSPRAGMVLVSVLSAGEPSAADESRAEPLIAAALKKFPDDAPLLFAVACLRTAQRRDDDAAALYARVRQLRPRHVPALNNLAAVLSGQPRRRQEALGYINRAIELAGRRPALLDTKAMVLLESDPRQAVTLLREAASQADADPRHHLHMARAYQRLGDLVQARAALQRAVAGDLDRATLTGSDARMLEQLETALRESAAEETS